ncbi:MAG: LuxR C-terminal-related transcriptional regulator [Xanthomonadales bacterium]|jgi:DNA-binding CsgD family transcriptional regulator|nr:LuxR C-terminal-related transcriptional regulator [Xanthomonadales bacterium]
MPDPLTSLLLVLALAAGLGSAIIVAQQVQTGQAEFYRYFLTHILLFNLLILAGLVWRFVQPQEALSPALVPLVLALMAALKLGWLYSFFITARLLTRPVLAERFKRTLFRTGLLVLITYVLLGGLAWFNSLKPLLEATLITLEALVIGGAAWAAGRVTVAVRRVPAGRRKNSLAVFGGFHLALLLIVLAVLVLGWVRPGPQDLAQTLVNSAFLLLFNLFPPFWIRLFRPAPAETDSAKFESLGITPREKQIVQLVQAGKTNQEIADELFISVATVKDHNNNLFRKCGVRNRVELANLFR